MKKLALTAASLFLAFATFAGDGGKKDNKKCEKACCKDPKCVEKCEKDGKKCAKDAKACHMDEAKKEVK